MPHNSLILNNNLIQKIVGNRNLKFLDAASESSFNVKELLLPIHSEIESSQRLCFLYLDSSVNSLAIYFSFLNSNCSIALLSDSLDDRLKENLEELYRPNYIYDSKRTELKSVSTIVASNDSFNIQLFRANNFEDSRIDPNIKVLLSTSGTTGSPKFVKLSLSNLYENAHSIADYLPINGFDVTPLNLPLNYSYGLSVLHSNAISGGTIVCGLPDILSKEFWNMLDKHGFTSIAGVPFIYEMLHRIGFLKSSYPSIKYISQAGGNLSKNIKERFSQYCETNHIDFYVMYGQTEATARISFVPPSKLKNKLTSIGKPIKNGNLKIDSESEELLYSGPNVFGGYAQSLDDLSHWETFDWLRTGDLAGIDDDGFFFIRGRIKRIVKVFGNRVNLDEIERHLKHKLNTSLIACTGYEDKFILVAYANESTDPKILKNEIVDAFKLPSSALKFEFISSFPKTKNEKVDYKEILNIYKLNRE